MNPLLELSRYGQSVWLDYIRRSLLEGGELKRLIEEDGLSGVTSNPSIFEKAITGSSDYAAAIRALVQGEGAAGAKSLYEALAIEDIRQAATILDPVYQATDRRDGYVSLEVSPHLASDTEGTCNEARRLWEALGRDNVMIKVPATPEGIPAVEALLTQGININVTLLFSLQVYEQVAEAYLRGLEALAERGGDPSRVASVASFFVSRIDTAVDAIVDEKLERAGTEEERNLLRSLYGRVAIANAVLTYQRYEKIFSGDRWGALARKGARPQRVLWASTSTKNPKYRDVLYVEELIGRDTVTTIPPATFDAFRDHGRLRASLEEDPAPARNTMASLEKAGISMREVTDKLLKEGLRLFSQSFEKLIAAVDSARRQARDPAVGRMGISLPADLDAKVTAVLDEWQAESKPRRLWARDATLWTGGDEAQWLGWLGVIEDQLAHLDRLRRISDEVRREGISSVLLLGMGGSSLAPEVLRMTYGRIEGWPELHVLDSTDPQQVKTFEKKVDPVRTLFIVSSKSGSTLEPNIFKEYFFKRVENRVGLEEAGRRFVAITDPGSQLQSAAERDGFRRVFFGVPSIGGRYSALSDFGMVPAAVMGVDLHRFLDRAEEMVHACAACVPAWENPGVVLGAILGVLGAEGRDKVTLITSPGIWDLGAWLEQLVAESTGKEGKALIPVDNERLGPPGVYGDDRLFVYLRLDSAPDVDQDAAVSRLEEAGHPVVRIAVADTYDLGQEFFRWEIATAVAGSILRINPFNQPDVEASKLATRELTSAFEADGSLPPEMPIAADDAIQIFTDERNASELADLSRGHRSVAAYLGAHLGRLRASDYFALLAYVEMNERNQEQLQAIRHAIRDRTRVATCLGFGPRFLHSTGQAYKGGPNTGVFLQVTCEDAADLPVPGRRYSFGVVKAAQARGDFQVLAERKRRALRVHLGKDPTDGLRVLRRIVDEILAERP